MTTKTVTTVGAVIGLLAFLCVGLLPSMLYGGFAGVMLASGLSLGPVVMKFMIVFGCTLGATAVGFLFMVLGAILGAAASKVVL